MKYARIINGAVNDFFEPLPGFTIEQCLHPELAAQYEPISSDVEIGYLKNPDGSFSAPIPPVIPVAEV